MSVNRRELIERIESLSDEDMDRVGPYLEADLDTLVDLDALRVEIAAGREGARTELLIDNAEVAVVLAVRHVRRRPLR